MSDPREMKDLELASTDEPQPLSQLVPVDEPQPLSRRQFLTGAAAGGAAGLAVAAGSGVAVWKVMDAEAQAAKKAADAQIARLQGLLELYETLEKIGLDAILETGMAAVALPLAAVEKGASALGIGLNWSEGALRSLEKALPTAQESIRWLEKQATTVAESIEKLKTALGKALDRAAGSLVAEALQDFAALVLDSLPFGLGDKIRDVLEGLVHLVTSVDDLVQGITASVLDPLHGEWFFSEEGEGLGASLVDPLVERVLDPLEAHLTNLAQLADRWQDQLLAPTKGALAERAQVRDEIARYRVEQGFE